MSSVRIVYPDANRHIGEQMSGARLDRVREVGQFAVHVGQPENDQQFIERIGGANALMLGWGLPVDVMNAAPHALLDISIDNILQYYRGDPVSVVAAPGIDSE